MPANRKRLLLFETCMNILPHPLGDLRSRERERASPAQCPLEFLDASGGMNPRQFYRTLAQ
jgi:hypothetical protein